MTVRQMSETQIAKWSRAMENQGVKVTRTKKGLLLRLPDGSSAMKHFTESDRRGPKNLASVLRRAGVTSPDDKKPATLPKYITEGTITSRSRERMIQFIESHDFPTMVFSRDVVDELGMDPGHVNRVLYHCGFTVGETMGRKGRPWYTPEGLLALKQKEDDGGVIPEEAKQIIDGARKAQEEVDRLTAPKEELSDDLLTIAVENSQIVEGPSYESEGFQPGELVGNGERVPEEKSSSREEPTPENADDIDFIDLRDSWVVDGKELLGEHLHRMVTERLSVLRAVGINYEIRVWRDR